MFNWLDRGSKMAIDRMPKSISPGTHVAIDYALAAGTAAFGIYCLRNNKAAGVAALIAAMAEATNVAMTDAPGGMCKTISFPLHGRIDMGLSGILAAMPKFMGFADTKESRFFYLSAAAASMVVAMTDFTGTGERAQSRYLLEAQR
jgi:hypothetical protein